MEKQNTKKESYKGQELKMGIDLHKEKWQVSICNEYLMLKTFSYPSETERLVKYVKSEFPGASFKSCYEAGYFGFKVHRELESLGVKNIVINASDVPTSHKEKLQKGDKRDSRKLAKCLRDHSVEGIYVPSIDQEQDRSLLRVRKRLVRDITRYKNRIKSYLCFLGIEIPEEFGGRWSRSFIKWLKDIDWLHESGRQGLDNYLELLSCLQGQLKVINKQIVHLSRADKYANQVSLIRSIKGFGLLSSMILLTELGPIERFKNEGQLKSYCGFIPTSNSSGERVRNGYITSRGNKYVRETLIECAWRAVGSDPSLSIYYESLRKNNINGNKAIIRIASKLIRRIRAMLLQNQPYIKGMA